MSKKEKRKELRQRSLKNTGRIDGFLLYLLICFAFLCVFFISDELKKEKLAEKGIVVKAYVFASYHGGKKGYSFQYPGLGLYDVEGKSFIKDKGRGDSLYVVFLPEDPWCNKPWREVKDYKKAKQRIRRGEVPNRDD